MKHTLLSIILLTALCSSAVRAQSPAKTNRNIIITAKMDTLRNIKILTSKKLTNRTQLAYLDKETNRIVLAAKEVHSYYNGTYFVSETTGKKKSEHILVGYDVRGPLSFGYALDQLGNYEFFYKQGTEILAIPKEEDKVYKKVLDYVINGDNFANHYKKKLYPEYKSLAEFASAYNAFISPKKYKPKKYAYLETLKPNAYFSVNYDDVKVQGFVMDYSFNAGVAIENGYARQLKVMFIPNIGISRYHSTISPFTIDIKTLGLEGSLGWSLKGEHNKIDLVIGPTFGAKYYLDSSITKEIGENIFKTQAIETLKVSYGLAGWLKISDKFTASLRMTTYGVQISATVLDNIEGADNSFDITSYQLGVLYRFN